MIFNHCEKKVGNIISNIIYTGFCPEKNINYGNGHGLQIRRNIKSWEDCSDLCSRSSDCNYWTWHHERAGRYSYICKTMTMKEYERKDRNCVSGTRACRRASQGKQPCRILELSFFGYLKCNILLLGRQ